MNQQDDSDVQNTVPGIVDEILRLNERGPGSFNSSSNQQSSSIRSRSQHSSDNEGPFQQQDQLNINGQIPFNLDPVDPESSYFEWMTEEEFEFDLGYDSAWNINDQVEKSHTSSKIMPEVSSHQSEVKQVITRGFIHDFVNQTERHFTLQNLIDEQISQKIDESPYFNHQNYQIQSNPQINSEIQEQSQIRPQEAVDHPFRPSRNIYLNEFLKLNQDRLLTPRSLAPKFISQNEKSTQIKSKKVASQCSDRCQKKNCSKCKKVKKITTKKQGCRVETFKKVNRRRKDSSSDGEDYADKGNRGRAKYARISFSGVN